MYLSLTLFLIGVLGFVFNRKNLILMLLSLELILLSVTLICIFSSVLFNDIWGQVFSIYIISAAAAESALILALLVAYYRTNGSIRLE